MIALINSPFLVNWSYELTLSIFPIKVRAKMKAALLFEARDALLFESLHRVAELPCEASLQLLAHLQPPVLREASVCLLLLLLLLDEVRVRVRVRVRVILS